MTRTNEEEIGRILEALVPLNVRARAMFGGHALYCDEKVVALVMDGEVYIKPSSADPAVLEGTSRARPHPRGGLYHLVPVELMHEAFWMINAIQSTANALPAPAPRKRGRNALNQA